MTKGLVIAFLFATTAFAGEKSLTAVFGQSFKGNSKTLIGSAGPSRSKNGEQVTINFRAPVALTSLKIEGVSLSKKGKVLVRNAIARPFNDDSLNETSLEALFKYSASRGTGKNYQDLVMLENSDSVSTNLEGVYSQIILQLEGFGSDDASVYVELLAGDVIENDDFNIVRTGSSEILGGFIDELNYANFKGPQLAALMKAATDPSTGMLDGHRYVCSLYGRQTKPMLDYKTRQFSSENDLPTSTATTDPTVARWAWSDNGWFINFPWQNPCGMSTTQIILKMTTEGNTISETVVNRYDFDMLCYKNKGWGQDDVEAALNKATFPSAIDNETYAVLSYEFCRLAD